MPTLVTIPEEIVTRKIFVIRGHKVMLDRDLAELYGVEVRRLNEQVRRNLERFPSDFMFQLTEEEARSLRSQFATLDKGRGRYSKYAPYAFTEHGVAMLSAVLNSSRAIQMSIVVVRTFIKLREILATNKDLAVRIEKLEDEQRKHASVIGILAKEIDKMKEPPPVKPKLPIGFTVRKE